MLSTQVRPRIAVITDDPGWHGKRLREALTARHCDTAFLSLCECRLDLDDDGLPVRLPGFENRLPEAVFVRGVPGGTLEQVVFYLDILHTLRLLGIPVYNDGHAIERTVDKGMTSFLLRQAGVPTPPTWVVNDSATARARAEREIAAGHSLVTKPLFGSQGKGLRRLARGDAIPEAAEYAGVWYLQRFLPSAPGQWRDWRVLVAGGAAVAAMVRRGRSWINNVARGARCEPCEPDPAMSRLALDAARALGMDYAGVDIMRDARGALTVIEVNSIPAWKGLQGVTGFDIAQRLVDDFVQRRLRPRLEAAG